MGKINGKNTNTDEKLDWLFYKPPGVIFFLCLSDSKSYLADLHIKVYLHITCRKTRHTQTHTLKLFTVIWNLVGGTGQAECSGNSSGATPLFLQPRFPFLRSAQGLEVLCCKPPVAMADRSGFSHSTSRAQRQCPDGPPCWSIPKTLHSFTKTVRHTQYSWEHRARLYV